MKSLFKKFLISLPLLALTLTSCANTSKSVKVALNLDLLNLNENEKAFPKDLTGDQLIMMIESKQDFVLYFHQNNCEMCKMVNPYFTQLLTPQDDKKTGYIPYNIYGFSANSSDFKYIYSLYPNLLDQTPKTMFFKGGSNILTLATSRYKSYKTFESAITQFAIPSKVYTARKDKSIKRFIEKMENKKYLVFVRNTNKDENKIFTTYEYWGSKVFPIVSESKIPTLLITYDLLEEEAKKTVNETYGLTSTNQAIYVEDNFSKSYDYLDENSSKEFINFLNEKF